MLAVFLISLSAFAVDNPWKTKLPFKNATIKYNLTGTMKGTKMVYVKDYGKTIAEYSETSTRMLGMTQQSKTITIITPDWEYEIDLTEGTGTKQVNPKKYFAEEFNSLSKKDQKKVVKNADKLGISMIAGFDGTVKKKAKNILGYSCDEVIAMGTKAYTIAGTDLPLLINGNTMGMKIHEEATSISKSKPSASTFKIPTNIPIEHNKQSDRMMQAHAKSAIQDLLSGNMAKPSSNYNQGNTAPKLTPEQQEQMKKMMQMFGNQ
ncbi:MAG: hypothetical protein C0603_12455 [Denitrovibrio sp.]|nr:MAG: hypothetical protein C0603_12455 [Denitrovibrio sp.]